MEQNMTSAFTNSQLSSRFGDGKTWKQFGTSMRPVDCSISVLPTFASTSSVSCFPTSANLAGLNLSNDFSSIATTSSVLDNRCEVAQTEEDCGSGESAGTFSLALPIYSDCADSCSSLLWENFIYSSPTCGHEDREDGSTRTHHSPDHLPPVKHECEERTSVETEKAMDPGPGESADDVQSDSAAANNEWKSQCLRFDQLQDAKEEAEDYRIQRTDSEERAVPTSTVITIGVKKEQSGSGEDGSEKKLEEDNKSAQCLIFDGLTGNPDSNSDTGRVNFLHPKQATKPKPTSPSTEESSALNIGQNCGKENGSKVGVLATAFVTGGVVRLAPSSKMEYPHHHGTVETTSSDSGQTSTIVVHSSHDGIVMHPQHVEVIKHVPPLQHNSPTEGSLAGQHMSPKDQDLQGASVLQEMKNMCVVPSYGDPYGRTGGGASGATVAAPGSAAAIYSQVTAGVYDSLGQVAAAAAGVPSATYGTLTGLPPTQHLLSTQYATHLLNPGVTGQEYAYHRSTPVSTGDYYVGAAGVRPVQQTMYESTEELIERLNRHTHPGGLYKPVSLEMPSPVDSGLGQEIMVTPKHEAGHEMFPYSADLVLHAIQQQQQAAQQQQQQRLQTGKNEYHSGGGARQTASTSSERGVSTSSRDSPVHIPKIHSLVGFQYTLEAPISTSVRKEDDRMTYVNKGQFYTVTQEYIPDASKPLKSNTVRSVMMLVFREDKPYEEEIKCWQFWHARQHSAKQRILDVDQKNSSGIVGSVEEIAHNAVAFYWNPLESQVKINIAVQCLSTDFSNQKGVKGLSLHVQVDTFDENHSKNVPFHRAFCQIKVFCDKGANRKMLHEQRRDEKRRLQGRKKSDCEYHELVERSEFYHMSNLTKPAVLFVPPEDYERFPPVESFYAMEGGALVPFPRPEEPINGELGPSPAKRQKSYPTERVMIYVRKPDEGVFTPLHLIPSNVDGLFKAVADKYNVDRNRFTAAYKQCKKGITVKMDDDMVRHYCNEDTFILHINAEASPTQSPQHQQQQDCLYSLTLIELDVVQQHTSNALTPTSSTSPS